MGYLWIFGIVISCVLTVLVASKFNLKRIPAMIILNIVCPFAGLFYALYVVHVVVPAVVKKEYGQDVESPLQPYIDEYTANFKARWNELTGGKDDKTL